MPFLRRDQYLINSGIRHVVNNGTVAAANQVRFAYVRIAIG